MSSPGIPVAASAPPPPPPPPVPPVPGQVPAVRISTASEYAPRKTAFNGPQDPYEPPAAIQNAMMTKDKKPFTYTPGMGGKLDLSQIRSPRMARRVAKNANDEGIEGPPKSSLAQQPTSPSSPQQPSIYSHPQVAIPVFPQGMPQQPANNLRNSTISPRSPPVVERQQEQQQPAPRPVVKVETRIQPVSNAADSPTSPPTSPTQVTLSKAPTPWMQKQVKQQDELPEWARRSNNRGSEPSSQPDSPPSPAQPRQIIVVNTAQQPQPPQQQQMRPVRQESERFVPMRIEDRPSVFSALNDGGHHQLSNSTPHHQSRWGNPVGQSAPVAPQQSQGGARLIPIQVDGQAYPVANAVSSPTNGNHQMQFRNHPVDNQANRNAARYQVPSQQAEPGPVQSKSFRVLQKITDTDADVDEEQIRKLQLSDDDRCLMNKFKEQVDGDGTYLHKEEDPRYRGAAIPSRAFRYLQNMTDSGDAPSTNTTPRPVNSAVKKQNRNSNNFEEVSIPVVHVPASEQQVPEPKKYTGGAIPSRSFRILQAMTAPESIATQVRQENRQDSATGLVIMPADQQAVRNNPRPDPPNPPYPTSVHRHPEIGWAHYHSFDEPSMSEIGCDSEIKESSAGVESESLTCNSALYAGFQRKPAPVADATTNEKQLFTEERREVSESPSSFHCSADDTESDKEESACSSSKRRDYDEEHDSANSSDTSCDSDSYLAYSTGRCSRNQQYDRSDERNRYSTIDRNDRDEDKGSDRKNDQEDVNSTSVSISLPLRVRSSVSIDNDVKDDCSEEKIETYVAFTLKRPNSQEDKAEEEEEEAVEETIKVKPTFIVTSMDDEEGSPERLGTDDETTKQAEKRQSLLTVRSHSKDESVTDDDDSGVTSDTSRVISEAETDSECCQPPASTTIGSAKIEESSPVKKRVISKYNRVQTHSRLFGLLNDEQLRSPRATPTQELAADKTSEQEQQFIEARPQLIPARPKSLDCEALFRTQAQQQEPLLRRNPANLWPRPRSTLVICPRVRGGEKLPQSIGYQRTSSYLGPASSSYSPAPARTSWRC